MFLSDLFSGFLKKPVGNNLDNDPDDITKTKELFANEGYYKQPVENGYIDKELDDSIWNFQRDNDLKQDGIMNPGGETETALISRIREKSKEEERESAPPQNFITAGGRTVPAARIRSALEKTKDDKITSFLFRIADKTAKAQETSKEPPVPKKKPQHKETSNEENRVKNNLEIKKNISILKPNKKPPILTRASDEDTANFVKKQEGSTQHLYKDHKGFITIGVGHRVTSLEKAKTLPFYLYDKNESAIRPATEEEIKTLYQQVQSIKHGKNITAEQYNPLYNKNKLHMKNIKLKEKDELALLKQDLRVRSQELRRNWSEFDNLPGELQTAMLDVHFNTGNLTPKKWPKLKKAIQQKNKAAIIREIHRDTKHQDRNRAIQHLLRKMTFEQ